MNRKQSFLVLVAVLVLSLAAGLAASAQGIPQEPAGQTDVTSAVVTPGLIYLLKDLENRDPANTVFKVQEGSATVVSTSGNLNRVAEFLPLENTVRVKRLYFRQALEQGVLSFEGDAGSTDDRRIVARYSEPQLFNAEVRDTRVLHRLPHVTRGVDEDTRPGDQYLTRWERTELTGSVALGDLPVRAEVRSDNQSRSGTFQHTFFQIHRGNCTNCHTVSASQGMGELTRTFEAGLLATPGERTVLGATFGSSNYDDRNTRLIYNFGGPFGTSPTSLNLHSRDTNNSFVGATGGDDWRVSAQFQNTERLNDVTGNAFKGRYFSGQGVYQPNDWVQVLGGVVTEAQNRSLSSTLSLDRSRGFLEVNVTPAPEAYANLRIGRDETRYGYAVAGHGFNDYKLNYYELRGGFRPDPTVRLSARVRADDIDHPFFPTDPTSRTLWEASASWSPAPVTVGFDYRNFRELGPVFSTREQTGTGYVIAMLDNGFGAHATYSVSDLDSNSSAAFFLDDPTGAYLPLQTGLPYTSTMKTLVAGLDIPFGQSGYRLRPTYRRTDSESQSLLLPLFPAISADSRLKLSEETVGLRFDFPAWDANRLGIGWEQQRWRDMQNAANDGTFNLFMVNYSTRY